MSEAQKPLSKQGQDNWDRIFRKRECKYLSDRDPTVCRHGANETRVCEDIDSCKLRVKDGE